MTRIFIVSIEQQIISNILKELEILRLKRKCVSNYKLHYCLFPLVFIFSIFRPAVPEASFQHSITVTKKKAPEKEHNKIMNIYGQF